MKFILSILLLFAVNLQAQIYKHETQLQSQRGKRISFGTTSAFGSDSTVCYRSDGDSITLIRTLTSPFVIGFVYKRQTKETMQFYWKVHLKWLGSTTTRLLYGIVLFKNGSRVQFNDTQFDATTVYYARWLSTNYTTTGGAGVKTFTKNINFATLPAYDSLYVYVSTSYSVLPTNPQDYFTFCKDDLYLKPIKNDNGLLINKITGFNPYLNLPDTIFAVEDNYFQIFNDEIAYYLASDKTKVSFDWTSDLGFESDTALNIYSPSVGNYNVKCQMSYQNRVIETDSCILAIEPKKTIGSKNLLMIGNSLTNNGAIYYEQIINDSLDIILNCIGTKGNIPYKHEGISGWDFTLFLGNTSPFYLGGKIDFAQYFTNLGSTADIIRVALGVNDAHAKTSQEMLNLCTQFIDSILNQTTAEIIIYLPPLSSNTNDFWIAQYGNELEYETYVNRIHTYNNLVLSRFDNGRYNSRIHVAYDAFVVDRSNSYIDYVHLSPDGYKQLIKGTSNIINHINQ